MGHWALYLLGTVGLVMIVTQSHIAKHARRLYPPLMCCPMCFGTWAGFALGLFWILRPTLALPAQALAFVLATGFSVSLLSFVLYLVLRAIRPGEIGAEDCQHGTRVTRDPGQQ